MTDLSGRLIHLSFSYPWSDVWHRINIRCSCPLNAVRLSCLIGFLLGLPYLINSTAYSAVTSLCTVCLYIAYGLPLLCKVFSRNAFPAGPFQLGRWSFAVNLVALLWICLIVVLFVLPPESPVTFVNMNYASVGFGLVLLVSSLVFLFSARHWFRGPQMNKS